MPTTTHTPIYKLLLAKLREARSTAGLTQEQAASRLGKHQSYISKIESGEQRVDVVELFELSRVYKQPLAWMLADFEQYEEVE